MTASEALEEIIALAEEMDIAVDAKLKFTAKKIIADVLDYCHREDFPEALCYSVVGGLSKMFEAAQEGNTAGAPLKKITQDDTSFEFAVAEADTSLDAASRMLNQLKPILNIYRRIQGR